MRDLLGRSPEGPTVGEKLICLRNDRKKLIINGGLWKAERVKTNKDTFSMRVASIDEASDLPVKVKVRKEFFEGTENNIPWEEKKGTQEFTYGYAITCHKAQGSQWNNTIVFDEAGAFRDEAHRWRYTAITRAAESVTLVV